MTIFIVASNFYDMQKHRQLKCSQKRAHPEGYALLALAAWELFAKAVKKERNDKAMPLVSVLVPAHNEERVIIRCVRSILENDYRKIEVIVVDDGSTDSTYNKVLYYRRKHKHKNLHIIKRPKQGKAAGLNYAIKRYAKGSIVMCLDADSALHSTAIRNGVSYFNKDPHLEALSSNIKIIDDGSLLSLIQRFEYMICYQMKKSQTLLNIEYIIGGIGSMFRKSALKQVDFYDTDTMTEDIDVTFKLIRRGSKRHKVAYASNMVAYTESVTSIGDLIRQRYRWKYGRLQAFFKNRIMFFSTDKKHHRALTWIYLPYAIFGEIAFFVEPMMVAFMITISLLYADTLTFYSAYLVLSGYIVLNVVGDEHTSFLQKIQLLVLTPPMYLLFFVLSFVEYAALVKSLANIHRVKASIEEAHGQWTHVKRTGLTA